MAGAAAARPGAAAAADARIDPLSGLPFNGETWPVVVPSYVSIQGTSALDTIFDARFKETAILEVIDPTLSTEISHLESFIDSVTIRNARANSEVFGSGAGIYIHSNRGAPWHGSAIFVTNCFITNNVVGIGVDSFASLTPSEPVIQVPRIINNTIAWNAIGLWSGNTRLSRAQSINTLVLLNNVFDSVGLPGYIAGQSGFEGVSDSDTRVVSIGGVPIPPQDFNAWEDVNFAFARGVNLGVSVGAWPVTLPNTQLTAPRINLTPWTKRPGGGRQGTLYINDTFHSAFLGIDHSPHDFRLAPMVTFDKTVSPGVQDPLLTMNPLVNMGVVADVALGTFPIVMQGGWFLTAPPGLPLHSDGATTGGGAYTRLDGWDYDAEGFGNPRIHHHPGYVSVSVTIDIGADEMGPLVMAGNINGTRILTPEGVPNAPGVNALSNHGAVYFFARTNYNSNVHTRPETNFYDAKVLTDWYAGVQASPAIDADVGNYTTAALGVRAGGTTAERRQDIIFPGSAYEAFMRGLECDFTPHLPPDPHPFWGAAMTIFPLNPAYWPDIYACNPWYDHQMPPAPPVFPTRRDNPTLFHNVGGGSSTSWLGTFSGPMFVLDATLNPPGTFPQAGRWTLAPTVTFGPYAPCTGTSPTTFSVGDWGFGDVAAGCPDVVPFMGTLLVSAVRFNCERIVNGVTTTNLQTMLGIHAPQPPEAAAAAARQGTRIEATAKPTVDEVRRIMRAELRRRS